MGRVDHELFNPQLQIQTPLIACGPEFGIFSSSVKSSEKVNGVSRQINKHALFLFGWDSKKVFQKKLPRTGLNFVEGGGLLLKSFLVEPIELPKGEFVGDRMTHLVCGGEYFFVVMDNKKILSKGYNSFGQLGLGNKRDSKELRVVPHPINSDQVTVESIACGLFHTVILLKDQSTNQLHLLSCGNNRNGQCMQPFEVKNLERLEVVDAPFIQQDGVSSIHCEYQSTWIMTKTGKIFAGGLLSTSEAGSLPIRNIYGLIQIQLPFAMVNPKKMRMACGGYHTLIVNNQHESIVGVGTNNSNQMSINIPEDPLTVNHPLAKFKNYRRNLTGVSLAKENQENHQVKSMQCWEFVKEMRGSRDSSVFLIDSLPTPFCDRWENSCEHVGQHFHDIHLVTISE